MEGQLIRVQVKKHYRKCPRCVVRVVFFPLLFLGLVSGFRLRPGTCLEL